MVYLWKIPDDYPENLIGRYDRKKGPDRFLFKQGRQLGREAGSPVFTFNADRAKLRDFDDLANNALVPLVSERIARVLHELCPDDVELVAAIVLANGEPLSGYEIVNVLNRVKGIDHSASEYSTMHSTNAILSFRKLRYRDGCLGELNVARDAEYSSNLLVSERLRNAFVTARVRGVGFYRPEETSW